MTSTVLGVALAVSLTLSTILVVVLTRPLRLVLTTLCERGEGVSFWSVRRMAGPPGGGVAVRAGAAGPGRNAGHRQRSLSRHERGVAVPRTLARHAT